MVARLYGPPAALGELDAELEWQARRQSDLLVPADDVRMDSVRNLKVRGVPYPMRREALDQLAARVRVPAAYLRRCPDDLVALNVNRWLGRMGGELLVRLEDGQVRAVLSARYQPVSHLALVRAMLEHVPEETPVRYELSAQHFAAQVLTPGALSGGGMHGGIYLGNSETGHRVVEMQALVYRVICLNGLILADAATTLRRRHTREAMATLDEAREMAGEAWRRTARMPDRFEAVRSIRVPKPKEALEHIGRRFQLGEPEQMAIGEAFEVEPGDTLFDVINAVTRAGNSPALSLTERTDLQQLGGRILDLAEKGERWL
jgi:hypothetical protein